jgi:hypothetical protein
MLIKIAFGAFHCDVLHSRNFSANAVKRRCAGIDVTGMRSLERAMKIVANAAVHKSTQSGQLFLLRAKLRGADPGRPVLGEGRITHPLPHRRLDNIIGD